jgi:nitroimidazol reductase NimA-like FMN-containing flavoprotein (pyridoxamine 5'-phosphate oxidase superfamily)
MEGTGPNPAGTRGVNETAGAARNEARRGRGATAPFDIDAFLDQPLVARLATAGPTVRPVWYLFEDDAFWILTPRSSTLLRRVRAQPEVAMVVDVCDLRTGIVRQVNVRGRAEELPYDVRRARRLLARYCGPDETRWDEAIRWWYVQDPTRDNRNAQLRIRPRSWVARDLAYRVD